MEYKPLVELFIFLFFLNHINNTRLLFYVGTCISDCTLLLLLLLLHRTLSQAQSYVLVAASVLLNARPLNAWHTRIYYINRYRYNDTAVTAGGGFNTVNPYYTDRTNNNGGQQKKNNNK